MESQSDSKIPGASGGGSGRGEKRRSFLPAPKRPSAIPSPTGSASSVATDVSSTSVKLEKRSPNSEEATVEKNTASKLEKQEEEGITVKESIPGAEKLTVGKRILIGGVKPGVLRFVGQTSLAPGYWCGIELFDASGLHDGEVDGKRYFTCKPFRGIFAPLDKVVPDELHDHFVPDEKDSNLESPEETKQSPDESKQPTDETKQSSEEQKKQGDRHVLEIKVQPAASDNETSKLQGPSKSQIPRQSGIPRIGLFSQDKGVVKSKSADGIKESTSKIAVLFKRSISSQGTSNVGLNSTFVRGDGESASSRRKSEDEDGESLLNQTFSCSVGKHLMSDSRQYFNITFNKDTPPPSNPTSNLPDVVSSASPSPPRETATRTINGALNETQSAQEIASSIASDISLGLMEPDILADDTNLLEGIIPDRVAASTSESDVSLSGTSSTLDETSVATVNEAAGAGLTSTPLHGVDFKKYLDENGQNGSESPLEADFVEIKPSSSVKQNLTQTFTAVARSDDSNQRKDSTSSISGIAAVKADLLQEEGSNGVSPEVSQVLEWDYDHDAFDGKLLLEKCQDGMSTSTSDSCSEASADQGANVAEKGIPDADVPATESETHEESEDGFESIDNIDDFPLGMSKETPHIMTDSGISEKGYADPVSDAASKRKSVEFDSKVSVVDLPGESIVDRITEDDLLHKDLMDGHTRQERPLSLVSTTSADTGYVPDTDSEAGTLTTNSPTDWADRQVNTNAAASSTDPRQRAHVLGKARPAGLIGKGLPDDIVKETGTDSDICCDEDDAAGSAETPSERTLDTDDPVTIICKNEPEDSEGEDDDSSEEETDSEEEGEEEEKEEAVDDDRPEDDRIEADRVCPSEDTFTVDQSVSGETEPVVDPVPPANQISNVNSDMTESTNLSGVEIPDTNVTTESLQPSVSDLSVQQENNGEPEAVSASKPESGVCEELDQSRDVTPSEPIAEEASTSGLVESKDTTLVISTDQNTAPEPKKTAKSRLTDKTKTSPPSKVTDEKKVESKIKKPNSEDAGARKTMDKKPGNVVDKRSGNLGKDKAEKRTAPVKEEKPKVKRPAPKSKWGNIMSQIEAGKDTTKVKAKPEAASTISAYLTSPPSQLNNVSLKKDENLAKQKEEIPKPKSKLKLVKHSKPDFSNVKSKLSLSNPPKQTNNPRDTSSPSRGSTPREDSPKDSANKHSANVGGNPKGSANAKDNPKSSKNSGSSLKGSGSAKDNPKDPSSPRGPGNVKEKNPKGSTITKKMSISKVGTGKLLVDHKETLDNWSTMSQATSSRTDLSVLDDLDAPSPVPPQLHLERKRNALSCAGTRPKNERASSVASTKSDASTAQRSVKSMNLRNAQKNDPTSSHLPPSKKAKAKSSIPPPTRRGTNLTGNTTTKPPTETAASPRSKSSPPKLPAPKSGPTTTTSAHSSLQNRSAAAGTNQGRFRSKGSSGLKSGHPPDVVSTSARGSRAQEIARLESLCEARTKELNYTKMQLRAGLQAFDAMTCLLNYCTTQLNAFSCPAITAQLHTAEGKLTQQQETIESLTQHRAQVEQQLREVTEARDSALLDITKLKQEMVQAEEAHNASQLQLKEEQATAIKTLEEELNAKHEKTVEQMQKCQEKQDEMLRQAHKRQITEQTAEHQIVTNQLKLSHLEEIQELRNKHDQQMEELHAQHRNKLEDITHRFESIKVSLSEKVKTLCVECDELRMRAKTSEEALQRDADVKVQLALAPYLHLPKEIESLKMVIDMRTEEIQKLRRHNMDLEKQLEELPIAQEKVVSLQQKIENLQAIINLKTDHEKQLHEKCQVLMRKYDRESRANKRLSMDYEQVVWRMSQSADLTGSTESLGSRHLSTSPGRGEDLHCHSSPSPVRRSLSNMSPADGVARRQRKISGGDEDFDRRIRCRSATFSLDKSKSPRHKSEAVTGLNGSSSSPGSPSKQGGSRAQDHADLIVAAMNSEHNSSFSSGNDSGDMADFQASMESSVILETPQGVSYNISVVHNGSGETGDRFSGGQDDVFTEPPSQSETNIPHDLLLQSEDVPPTSDVTVVVNSPTSD